MNKVSIRSRSGRRSLELEKESVRALSTDSLDGARGGLLKPPCSICGNSCCDSKSPGNG